MEKILSKILEETLHLSAKEFAFTQLHGDASNRIYYRLSLPSKQSFIVMQLPQGPASISEEITNIKTRPKELPFINIDRYLQSQGLPVPRIYYENLKEGLLLLEDFGDETFEKVILKSDAETQKSWYQKAIDLLVSFQSKGANPDPHCIAFQRSFDQTLLDWEFEHFFEYGIEVRQNKKIDPEDLKILKSESQKITKILTEVSYVLVHRDFQSRNLMIQNDHLKLLDFQDALMGPLPYDLVALLRDSYINLPWETVSELVDYFVSLRKDVSSNFRRGFDLMTIQRKLKDTGRFVYIDRVKKNPNFLKHISDSLAYVRSALERQKDLKNFYEIIKKYVPEFH